VACVDEPIDLPPKVIDAAERRRIEHLHEHGRTPAADGIGAAEPGKAAGERLDEERQRVAFMPGVQSAQRQQRALGIVEQHRGIVGGVALRVLDPWMRQLLAGLVQTVR
jgi:hypothetical protein